MGRVQESTFLSYRSIEKGRVAVADNVCWLTDNIRFPIEVDWDSSDRTDGKTQVDVGCTLTGELSENEFIALAAWRERVLIRFTINGQREHRRG